MKNRSINLVLLLFLLVISVVPFEDLQAQINTDLARSGSVYSYFGIGVPTDFSSADADPMGLNGVSFYDAYVPNLSNPAQWGSAVYTQASGGLLLQQFKASDPFSKATNVNIGATHFQSVFPLMKGKLGLSVSLTPITRSSYRVYSDVTLPANQNNSGDELHYAVENRGDGGFDQFELGLGWRINKTFSVGYAGSIIFGETSNELNTLFEDSQYSPIQINQSLTGRGFRHRLGLFVNNNETFSEDDELAGGVSVTFPTTLNGDFETTTDVQLSSGQKSFPVEGGDYSGDITLPLGIDGGISYRFSENVTVASELRYQKWSQYENFVGSGSDESVFVDRIKLGTGIKYLPYLESSSTFLSRFKYFGGVSYDTGHLSLNGERIKTLMGSVGIGIPAPRSRSSIHLSLQYGTRGTQTADLVQEQIWSFRISFNLAEMMFVQSKFQ